MSQTVLSVAVNLLAFVLPKIGVTLGSDQLTTTVQTLLVIGSALWIYWRRVSKGDVNALGKRV